MAYKAKAAASAKVRGGGLLSKDLEKLFKSRDPSLLLLLDADGVPGAEACCNAKLSKFCCWWWCCSGGCTGDDTVLVFMGVLFPPSPPPMTGDEVALVLAFAVVGAVAVGVAVAVA